MNGQYIKNMGKNELKTAIEKFAHTTPAPLLGEEGTKIVKLAQERMEKLSDFELLTNFLFTDKLEYESDLLVPKGLNQTQCKILLQTALIVIEKIKTGDWEEANLRKTFLDYCEQNNVKRGDLLWPLRVAVTGLKDSPDVFAVVDILGKDKTMDRIKNAVALLTP